MIHLSNALTVKDITQLLALRGKDAKFLHEHAREVKKNSVGNVVYFRGLVEYSNICSKNCYYCGIRAGNQAAVRYKMSDDEVLEAIDFAWKKKYASVVLQAGEISGQEFTDKIEHLLKEIHRRTNGEVAVTLSLGEQTREIYEKWRAAGASRYLLRIETSNPEIYNKIHPTNTHHSFEERLRCLHLLRELDYQVGSGVMIGLPFQTVEDVARDLLFLKEFDVDMVGMGPYLEHEATPLFAHKDQLLSKQERFDMAINAVAILRILMPDINIAATTALQSIDPTGREKAIEVGANVIMPNLTPTKYRENYLLYENKPCIDEDKEQCAGCLETRIRFTGNEIGYGSWGDAQHYQKRKL